MALSSQVMISMQPLCKVLIAICVSDCTSSYYFLRSQEKFSMGFIFSSLLILIKHTWTWNITLDTHMNYKEYKE